MYTQMPAATTSIQTICLVVVGSKYDRPISDAEAGWELQA